jgi:2-C-methyl-D-erythritol 4-phosphate cytidylyltransferase
MNRHAIIVAGGKGLRMGAQIPKQFLELNGMPVLMHTIKSFRFDPNILVTLVLPFDQFEYWKWLCKKHHFDLPHQLVQGGDTRFQSVRNGLNALPPNADLVAIHDGVRPIINAQIIQNGLRAGVYELSKHDIILPPQNIDQLKIIMRSIYFQFAENKQHHIQEQVARLNKIVLDEIIPKVYNEAMGYLKYMQDQSSLVVPMERPLHHDRNYKQLELKPWF